MIDVENISLDISNSWVANNMLTDANSGTFVAFDWRKEEGEYYLTEINTNIDLGAIESENFKYYRFIHFLKENNFNFVLGLRNNDFFNNPSEEWTDKLKESLKSNEMEYDEYITDKWPSPIPDFDVPDNVFILRYAYDEYCKVDKLAASSYSFKNWIETSEWKEYYKKIASEEVVRVTVFCSMIENFILKGRTYKMLFKK
jgi:hypothetical protein